MVTKVTIKNLRLESKAMVTYGDIPVGQYFTAEMGGVEQAVLVKIYCDSLDTSRVVSVENPRAVFTRPDSTVVYDYIPLSNVTVTVNR